MSPAAKVTEDAYAEQPALEWLGEVGWQHVHGPALAPGGAERRLDSDVVLHETLRAAVARLNPDLPPEAVARATELALTTTHASLIADHQAFHELLLAGVPVTWIDDEHGERSTRARLIDWDEPAGNVFQAVNQLTIVEGGANRRPDVLLYINGLPLGQLELKNPSLDEDGPAKAVNQVRHYSRTIPGLYRYVEVIGVSDLLRARVGTITTQAEHFAEWKTMDPAGMQGRSQLEVLITEVFTPAGLLDLIRNFVLFETDGARTWKVMAKYHQVDAVNRAVAATHEAMADRSRRAGVVWHTQGPASRTRWSSSRPSCAATGALPTRRSSASPTPTTSTTSSRRPSPARPTSRRWSARPTASRAGRTASTRCLTCPPMGSCSRRSRSSPAARRRRRGRCRSSRSARTSWSSPTRPTAPSTHRSRATS